MSNHEIVWEDPPRGTRKAPGEFDDLLDQLGQQPDRWARLALYDNPKTAHVAAHRLRKRVAVKELDIEVVARTLETGHGGLYARSVTA